MHGPGRKPRRASVRALIRRVMGMPLGFPPIPDEEIDFINTWIEQGAPE